MIVLGIDIGASRIRAASVDVYDGAIVGAIESRDTPQPATPGAVSATICGLADTFAWDGPIGIAFPGVVDQNVVRTAAHLDRSWIGVDLPALVSRQLGQPVTATNDADAAALAEAHVGAGRGHPGVVVTITLGAGVGSGITVDGLLVPNTELGHLQQGGSDMEDRVTARALSVENGTWESWGREADTYLHALENLLWPSLFIIGGTISADFAEFEPFLRLRTPVVAAATGSDAGIIGAALAHYFRVHSVAVTPQLPRR